MQEIYFLLKYSYINNIIIINNVRHTYFLIVQYTYLLLVILACSNKAFFIDNNIFELVIII